MWLVPTNAPTFFINLINSVFNPFLDKFVVVFHNNILIYFKDKEEYGKHLRIVLETLRDHKLYVKLKKCEFWLEKSISYGMWCQQHASLLI